MIAVALLGCGHRGREMAGLLCKNSERFHLIALVDDVPEARADPGGIPGFSYEQFLSSVQYENTTLVMVASVNNLHAEHIVRPLLDGKYVFCEKPLFTTWDERVVEVIRANAERFCTGFVLRHSPFYKTIKESIPRIGPIKSGTVSDLLHYGHGALIFGGGWRHDAEMSGGHVVEKLVHVIDLIVWFLDSPAEEAKGMKGPDMWVRDKAIVPDAWVMRSQNPKLLEAYKFYGAKDPFDHERGEIIESSGNVVLRFESGATVGVHFDTACPESRREFFLVGEWGTIHALWTPAETSVKVTICGVGTKASKGTPNRSQLYQFEPVGCHGGGDEFIIDALRKTVVDGAPPNPSAEEALRTMKATLMCQGSY